MVRTLLALLAGLIFGAGLVVSQMVDPAKVLGFLDIFGAWDPSLALVMLGAILVAAPAFALAGRMERPLAASAFQIPEKQGVDKRLVGGAVLFGLGWGLVGLCPGPALAAIGIEPVPALVFVAAMVLGMAAFHFVFSRRPGGGSGVGPEVDA